MRNQDAEHAKECKKRHKNFQCSKTDREGKFCAKDSLHVPNRFLRLIKDSVGAAAATHVGSAHRDECDK
jgi:hypothetical protein